MTLQKDALQVKTNLSEAVEKIKDLQANGVAAKDGRIRELNNTIKSSKDECEQLKKEKADFLKKIEWARDHVNMLDSKHTALEKQIASEKEVLEKDLNRAQQNIKDLQV